MRVSGRGQEDTDPRDKDTLIKTLIDLKAVCMEAEKTNRKMREHLEKGNLVLIQRGMRDQQASAQPDVQARLFGKFAFKEKKANTPYLSGVKSATQGAGTAPAAAGQSRSPALMKLLSTDHLQFREFSRSMLLHDVQLLTRYEQKLEAEAKQLKLDTVRLERQHQQLHSRVAAPSRPPSAPSARSKGATAASATARQGAGGDKRQPTGAGESAIAHVEQECSVALELASVLKSIQRDNQEQRRAAGAAARDPSAPRAGRNDTSHQNLPLDTRASGAMKEATAQDVGQAAVLEAAVSAADFADTAPGSSGGDAAGRSRAVQRLIYNVVIRTGSCSLAAGFRVLVRV